VGTAANPIYLDHLCVAVGELASTVEESAARGRLLSRPEALREAGFERHHICAAATTPYELARAAVEEIRPRLSGIGALVYATSLPCNGNLGDPARFAATGDVKYLMDFPVSHLQADFDLEGALVLGVNQLACTSLLGAIRLARMVLTAEPGLGRALCVTADRFPEGALHEQAYNLISDGAAGCVLSVAPGRLRIVGEHAITNGAMAFASDDETIGAYLSYTHRLIREALERAKLGLGDIHWIVPQNLNRVTWQVMCSLLRFDRERVLSPTMAEVGHMISGDNILNLKALLDDGRIAPGERLLLPMAGYGLNWHCLILEAE